jgi:hypothetical protein
LRGYTALRILQLRNGKRYLEFCDEGLLDSQASALLDPEVCTVNDSCPSLETLLQQAVEREDQAPDDPIEVFDYASTLPSDPVATLNIHNKRPFLEKAEVPHNGHRHGKRNKKRARMIQTDGHLHGRNAPAIQTCMAIPSNVNVATLPAATGGYIGKDLSLERGVAHEAEWYKSQSDWTYLNWDGRCVCLQRSFVFSH